MSEETIGRRFAGARGLAGVLVVLTVLALVVGTVLGTALAGGPPGSGGNPPNSGKPDNPPCDANHDHPKENSAKCDGAQPDDDADDDGEPDAQDNCPQVPNPGQENFDASIPGGDAAGDACDDDDDADNLPDSNDAANCDQFDPDTDDDGLEDGTEAEIGTSCTDPDSDDDQVPDGSDQCPLLAGTANNNGCPEDGGGGQEDNCVTNQRENGLDHLNGTELEGVASQRIHDDVEPELPVNVVGINVREFVHHVNCDVVVPAEDLVDGVIDELEALAP